MTFQSTQWGNYGAGDQEVHAAVEGEERDGTSKDQRGVQGKVQCQGLLESYRISWITRFWGIPQQFELKIFLWKAMGNSFASRVWSVVVATVRSTTHLIQFFPKTSSSKSSRLSVVAALAKGCFWSRRSCTVCREDHMSRSCALLVTLRPSTLSSCNFSVRTLVIWRNEVLFAVWAVPRSPESSFR